MGVRLFPMRAVASGEHGPSRLTQGMMQGQGHMAPPSTGKGRPLVARSSIAGSLLLPSFYATCVHPQEPGDEEAWLAGWALLTPGHLHGLGVVRVCAAG